MSKDKNKDYIALPHPPKFSDKDRVRVASANSHFFGQKGAVVGDAFDFLVSNQIYYYVRLDLGILPPLLFNEDQLAYMG